MSTHIEELCQRQFSLLRLAIPLTNLTRWDEVDGRQWDIVIKQMQAINDELATPPEEDDEPGGDIDWDDGGPLGAS